MRYLRAQGFSPGAIMGAGETKLGLESRTTNAGLVYFFL